jgi:hypothetical protein
VPGPPDEMERSLKLAGLHRTWILSVLLVTISISCGPGEGDEERGRSSAPIHTQDAGAAPDELVGSYSMQLTKRDLPDDPPPELADGVGGWTLTIANSGGIHGRSFKVVNDRLGTLEEPTFSTDGGQVFLEQQECAVNPPGETVESEYRWTLSGSSLTFEVVTNGCPDDVLRTLLTANPWTRQ